MALRFLSRRIIFALLAAFGAALSLFFGWGSPTAGAASAAVLDFPNAACGADLSVSFNWQPADGATEAWLDVSTEDNGFAPGSFQGSGPFGGSTRSFALTNLKSETPYFARVNSLTTSGWMPSETVAFVACGAPQLLAYSPTCAEGSASATFRWAPAAPAAAQQTLDAGADPSFSPANTRSSGTLMPLVNRFEMTGLRANVPNYFRVIATLADGSIRRSRVMSFSTTCASTPVSTALVPTGDMLVYSRLNIRAPVNVRVVGSDGLMGLPQGKDDVVLYDFSLHPPLGGLPGRGGTSILAGHLDYLPNFRGVFWDLARAREGDIIDYYREDGSRYSYQVAWVNLIPSDELLNQYATGTDPETMVLITCEGNWDTAQRNYDKRALVYAVAVKN
jgi:hypothetical protein